MVIKIDEKRRENVRKSKEMGGLGIRTSKPKNEDLILKLEWQLVNESHKSEVKIE